MTGYEGFDKIKGGFKHGELTVFGASVRPNLPKTMIAQTMAIEHALKTGKPVLYIDVESNLLPPLEVL